MNFTQLVRAAAQRGLSVPGFPKKYVANICGHGTHRAGGTLSFGVHRTVGTPLAENGKPDYCLACIGAMSVRCPCGDPIHVGDLVTLSFFEEGAKLSRYAVRYEPDPRYVVCCFHESCNLRGDNPSGRWLPPGKVQCLPTLTDVVMAGRTAASFDSL